MILRTEELFSSLFGLSYNLPHPERDRFGRSLAVPHVLGQQSYCPFSTSADVEVYVWRLHPWHGGRWFAYLIHCCLSDGGPAIWSQSMGYNPLAAASQGIVNRPNKNSNRLSRGSVALCKGTDYSSFCFKGPLPPGLRSPTGAAGWG